MASACIRCLLVLATVFSLAGLVHAQGVEIIPGQSVMATIEPGDLHVYRFMASTGDALSLKFKVGKGGNLDPEIRMFAHDATEVALPAVVRGKLSAKIVLNRGGTQYLIIRGMDLTAGSYKLALKVKSPKLAPRTVGVPGILGINLPRAAFLSAKIKAQKGSDLEPGIESITDFFGIDYLDRAFVQEKGGSVSIKGLPVPLGTEFDINLVARSGGPGDVDVKLKFKPFKPAVKKLGPDTLVETFCVRIATSEGTAFMAEVDGANVTGATLLKNLETPGTALTQNGDDEWSLEGDSADFPAGLYTLRVQFAGGRTQDFHTFVGSYTPDIPTITGTGSGSTPTITWTGISGGADFIHLAIIDPVRDEETYEVILPASATSHTLPAGLVGDGWPFDIELSPFHVGNSLAVAEAEVEGDDVDFVGALSIGDLLTYTLDTETLEYTYEVIEPVYDSDTGTLDPEPGWGRYVYRSGAGPDDPYVVILPGKLILGGTDDGELFAAVPRINTDYTMGEIAGLYNFIGFFNLGTDYEADYGTFRIIANGTFDVWIQQNATGTPDLTGNLEDQGNGVLHAMVNVPILGDVRIGNVMVCPGANGNLMVVDLTGTEGLTDPGIVLAVEQRAVAAGTFDGIYDVLETDEDELYSVEVKGSSIVDEEGPIKIKFNSPWTGFISGGKLFEEGGIGLLGPDGTLFLGMWFEDDPGTIVSAIGAAIKR